MAFNAEGWDAIFAKLPILKTIEQDGFFDISAVQIKDIAQREPRLMAKIDFREQLPPVMAKEGLALLAISNGFYRIGRFDPFIPVNPELQASATKVSFPRGFLTLNPRELSNEAAALDAALLSGILTNVFGEEVALTIRGRTRNVPFSFTLGNIPFSIDGVQIEIDGGYEGAKTVNLVEAKIGARSNISIRQLLYPHLAWEKEIKGRKEVRTFICFYQEPMLRFIPVVYDGKMCHADHSRELVFALEPEATLNLMAIKEKSSALVPVVGVPFPQADNFETVLAMFSIVSLRGQITKEELSADFDVVPRQIDYYSNIMRWLGLVTLDSGSLVITARGRQIGALPHAERIYELAQIIFGEPIFFSALRHGADNVPRQLFARWKCSKSTIERRLQTVVAWIRYFRSFEQP